MLAVFQVNIGLVATRSDLTRLRPLSYHSVHPALYCRPTYLPTYLPPTAMSSHPLISHPPFPLSTLLLPAVCSVCSAVCSLSFAAVLCCLLYTPCCVLPSFLLLRSFSLCLSALCFSAARLATDGTTSGPAFETSFEHSNRRLLTCSLHRYHKPIISYLAFIMPVRLNLDTICRSWLQWVCGERYRTVHPFPVLPRTASVDSDWLERHFLADQRNHDRAAA